MTDKSTTIVGLVWLIVAAVSFGIWTESIAAGVFIFSALPLVALIVRP